MPTWIIEHQGEYLPGYSAYVGDEEPTPEQIRQYLALVYRHDPEEKRIGKVYKLGPGMNLIWDGNY